MHDAEMQAVQLREEIAELQKKLSDTHLSIYDERRNNMQLARELYLLEQQARSNKQKLAEINSLSSEISQDQENSQFVNFKDCRPAAKTKAPLKPAPT